MRGGEFCNTEGPVLTLTNVTAAHAGDWVCVASNAAGAARSEPASLSLEFTGLVNLSARASVGTTLWEGAGMLLPRDTLVRAGGWADEFFYAHEGMDLCWRIWDGGQVAWYAADIISLHSAVSPRFFIVKSWFKSPFPTAHCANFLAP